MPQKYILIIEDEKTLSGLLREKLVGAGYRVKEAHNGKEGLAKISEEKPDLVLLDILMPEVSGFDVLENLSESGIIKTLPVIIISNSGQPVEIDKALALGVKDYLIKVEFTPQEVLEKVSKQIGEGSEVKDINFNGPDSKDAANEKHAVKEELSSDKIADLGNYILLVEDDKFLSGLLFKKLSQEFKVEVAGNGAEAFNKIKGGIPRLVLLDLMLPDIDGFKILEILKNDDRTKNIPVLILSNLGQKEDQDRSLSLGADGYMIKAHFTPGEIIEKAKSLLK
ncbi:MAG: response regulator [Parcubacteria group bacterium]|nr:response regulator [Parcubacteria group bacterium]MCR4343059.1 response regulator [Patescibacteria group bacterium]